MPKVNFYNTDTMPETFTQGDTVIDKYTYVYLVTGSQVASEKVNLVCLGKKDVKAPKHEGMVLSYGKPTTMKASKLSGFTGTIEIEV